MWYLSLSRLLRSLLWERLRSLLWERLRSLLGENFRSLRGECRRSLLEGLLSLEGDGLCSSPGECLRSLTGERFLSRPGEGLRSLLGEGLLSKLGEFLLSELFLFLGLLDRLFFFDFVFVAGISNSLLDKNLVSFGSWSSVFLDCIKVGAKVVSASSVGEDVVDWTALASLVRVLRTFESGPQPSWRICKASSSSLSIFLGTLYCSTWSTRRVRPQTWKNYHNWANFK